MPLPARRPFTLTESQAILYQLADVRAAGYSVNDQEIETGLRSIAVPIYSARRELIAAMNIGVSAARASPDELRQNFLPSLLKVQYSLRHMLGLNT